jgi:hypothetical protein
VTTKYIHELVFVERRMSASGKKQDLLVEAKSFCDGLSNVFLMKRRDPQSRNLLETAKRIIESLCAEKQKPPVPARGASGQSRSRDR